jgi:hypothetical protein
VRGCDGRGAGLPFEAVRRVGFVAGVLLVMLVAAAVAIASVGHRRAGRVVPSSPFVAQGSIDADGNPEPTVFSFPDGTQNDMHWSLCPASNPSVCQPIRSTDGTARPGPEPAGTVFKLTATYQGRTYTSSETWRGVVHALAPPTLGGRARFDATVKVRAGTWAGGFGIEQDQLGIEACRTAHGRSCVMLGGEQLSCTPRGGCGSEGGPVGVGQTPDHVRIGNWYTGWYLFGLDARLDNTLSLLVGFEQQAIPPWPLYPTVVRSRPYGPVVGPPAPRVRILPRAQKRGRRVFFATVHCAVRCHASLSVLRAKPIVGKQDGWSAHQTVIGTKRIGVTGVLPTGRLYVTVQVGDGPYITGRTRLSSTR